MMFMVLISLRFCLSLSGYKDYIVVPTQVEKKLANLNHCTVPFLSRAAVNLSWYDSIYLLNQTVLLSHIMLLLL